MKKNIKAIFKQILDVADRLEMDGEVTRNIKEDIGQKILCPIDDNGNVAHPLQEFYTELSKNEDPRVEDMKVILKTLGSLFRKNIGDNIILEIIRLKYATKDILYESAKMRK